MERRENRQKGSTAQLERELSVCREVVRNIIDRSADAILIIDREGYIRFANLAAAELFCLRVETLQGRAFGFPVVGGETTEIEVVCRGRPPTVAEMRAADTEWEGVGAWLAILRDVTERKRLEAQLKEALGKTEEALAETDAIIRSISEGLIVTDRDGRIRLMNHSAEILLGASCRAVAGLPIGELFVAMPAREKILASLKDERDARFDFELNPGGHSFPARIFSARSSPVRDRQEQRTGVVTILQDVTREREIERMKSEFVSFAAHELRSPLTSIVGFAEMLILSKDLGRDEQRSYAEIIKKQGLFLADIISTFLDLSLIESGRGIVLKKKPCTVAELFCLVDSFVLAHADRHRFEVAPEDKTVRLFVDQQRMKQVLENLVGNAVKYSPAGSVIRIEGAVEGEWYRLSVRDRGIGMTPQQAEQMFEKFYRADASSTAPGGIGLGMSIVKSIVELHDATISVQSRPGRGTTVTIRLPLEVGAFGESS